MKVKAYDSTDYLTDDEVMREYLNAALEDSNPDALILALSNVAKARGVAKLAEAAGVGRTSLYKTLTPGNKLQFETVLKLFSALNLSLSSKAKTAA